MGLRTFLLSSVTVAAIIGACTTNPSADTLQWTLTPSEGVIGIGETVEFRIDISSKANINSDLELFISPTPTGVVATFPARITSTATSVTGSFSAPPGTVPGFYPFEFNLREEGGVFGLTQGFRLTVSDAGEAPDFSVGVDPDALTLPVDDVEAVAFSVTPLNGYTGTVRISLSGLPDDVHLIDGPNPDSLVFGARSGGKGGTFLLNFLPEPPVPAQVELMVTVTDGTITHQRTVLLTLAGGLAVR